MEIVETRSNRMHWRVKAPELFGEIVDVEFINHQVPEMLTPASHGRHDIVRRRAAANDEPGILFFLATIARAWIGDLASRAVGKGHIIFVFVKPLRKLGRR